MQSRAVVAGQPSCPKPLSVMRCVLSLRWLGFGLETQRECMNDTDAPDIAERYITAGQSSNLKCDTREDAPIGAVGLLVAVGWSPSRIGAALLRLHTKPDRGGLEQVHSQIMLQADRWGIERPAAVSAAVLSWWLAHVCGTCSGVRFELSPGAPSLSNRHCKACNGTGEKPIPHGSSGKRLAGFMDDCKSRAVASIRFRLKAMK